MTIDDGCGDEIQMIGATSELPKEAGEKARGLQRLLRAGLSVPSSWVVLPGATRRDLEGLKARLRDQGSSLLAVRRSASNHEDQELVVDAPEGSLLGVPVHDLWEALARVAGLDAAAIVQSLVPAEVSGVVHGGAGEDRGLTIEWVEGLRTVLEQGFAAPGTTEIVAAGNSWEVRRLSDPRHTKALRVRCGRVEETPVGPGRRTQSFLSDRLARAIADALVELQWDLCYDVELHWAVARGKIWWLHLNPGAAIRTQGTPMSVWSCLGPRVAHR